MNIMLGVLIIAVVGLAVLVFDLRKEVNRKRTLENGILTTLVKSILKAYVKQKECDIHVAQTSNDLKDVNAKLQKIFTICDACKICNDDEGGD